MALTDEEESALLEAHASEIAIREAAIAERDAKVVAEAEAKATAEAALVASQAENYNLLKSIPLVESPKEETAAEETSGGIDSLFEREISY